jgi:hypothetical protein
MLQALPSRFTPEPDLLWSKNETGGASFGWRMPAPAGFLKKTAD